MNISEIFTSNYLLAVVPIPDKYYFWSLFGFFSFLIVVAIVIRLIKGWDIKIRLRQFYCFFICGVLGLLYMFASHERLPLFGTKLYLSLVVLTLIIWIIITVIWMGRFNKKLDNQIIMEERYGKYLPKKKR